MSDEAKAAKPLPTRSDREIAEIVGRTATEDNQKHATSELAMIFELRDNRSFQWFEQQCIVKKYEELEQAWKDPSQKDAGEISKIREKFLLVREIYLWLIQREIQHRETISPGDSEIIRLRKLVLTL